MEIHKPKISQVTVSQDGVEVILVVNGQRVLELPWDAAKMIAKAMRIQALRIEEKVKANQIAYDQGILLRKGIPIGLTSNPEIIQEAGKEAAWNSNLRRYLPGGVKSQEAFGAPVIIKHRRNGHGN